MFPTDDEVAQRMELALQRGNSKGLPYITRVTHGMVPAGTACNIWRTKGMSLAIEVFSELDSDEKSKAQIIVSYAHQTPARWVVYEYRAFEWICEGVENEDEHRTKLAEYFKTLKRKRRMPNAFKPY